MRLLIAILCLLLISGAAAYSIFAPRPLTPALEEVLDTKVTLEGVVVAEPDVREKSIFLTVAVEKINNTQVAEKTQILLSADTFAQAAYGDRVTASGKLTLPQTFETDTGRTFDYPKYLRAKGIVYVLSFAKVQVTASGEGNVVVAKLLSVKHFLEAGIQNALPEPESALAAGLLLGDKQSLGQRITDAFRKAGVVHIIVLSGYNVAVVIGTILFLALYFLPQRVAFVIAGLSVVAFAIMTGASETTIRAGAMAIIALFAKALHRPADGIRILLIVAAGMALWNPFVVLYDLSYQLSILSTLGLTLFSDSVQKKILFIPETAGFREIVATTLATQFTVLPLLILSVGQVSLVFLFTNILVLPAVSLAMLTSFIAAVLAVFSYALAFPFSTLAYAVLHYIIAVSVWFGSLPYAAVPIPQNILWLTLSILGCLYASVFFYFAYKRKTLGKGF